MALRYEFLEPYFTPSSMMPSSSKVAPAMASFSAFEGEKTSFAL